MVVNRWLYRVYTGPWAKYVRILPQLSRTASCSYREVIVRGLSLERLSLERLSLEGSTGGGVRGSSSRLAILRRFGAGSG